MSDKLWAVLVVVALGLSAFGCSTTECDPYCYDGCSDDWEACVDMCEVRFEMCVAGCGGDDFCFDGCAPALDACDEMCDEDEESCAYLCEC